MEPGREVGGIREQRFHDTNGGINGTPMLYQAANMAVDPKTNRLFVSDGYGNRRILIVDAETGKYVGHFGAYGNNCHFQNSNKNIWEAFFTQAAPSKSYVVRTQRSAWLPGLN